MKDRLIVNSGTHLFAKSHLGMYALLNLLVPTEVRNELIDARSFREVFVTVSRVYAASGLEFLT